MFFSILSPLYKELVESKVITTGISCGDVQIANYLLISIGSYSNKADIFEEKVRKTIEDLDSFNKEIFELDKKESILRIILRSERLMDTIMPLVDNIVNFHYPYPDTKEDIEKFSYEDFVSTMKSLDFSNYTVTSIKNVEKK